MYIACKRSSEVSHILKDAVFKIAPHPQKPPSRIKVFHFSLDQKGLAFRTGSDSALQFVQTTELRIRPIRESICVRYAPAMHPINASQMRPNQPSKNSGFYVLYNRMTITTLFFKYLDIVRVFADLRNVVLVYLVALPARNAQNQVVEGRATKNIDMVTWLRSVSLMRLLKW